MHTYSARNRRWSGGRRSRGTQFLRVLAVFCAGLGSFYLNESSRILAQSEGSPRVRLSLNLDWRFQKGDPEDAGGALAWEKIRTRVNATGDELKKQGEPSRSIPGDIADPGSGISYVRPEFDDQGWRKLDLPHDWGIEGPFKQEYPGETGKLPWWGIGWYRKHFTVDTADRDKRLFLDIDGAMSYAAVWLNGRFVGGWPYGYSSFQLDLTPHVRFGGENVLAIRLDNPPESSRWYPGGGIYRNVWLVKTAPIHVAHWGAFITTPEVTREKARVEIEISLANHSATEAGVTVAVQIYLLDAKGKIAGPAVAAGGKVQARLNPGRSAPIRSSLSITNPNLWSIKNPQLYEAVITIEQAGKVTDRHVTPFGIRSVRFDAENGFLLNGERVPLNGVCNHHDLGALGAAVNYRALERQIELLKEMGANAIRTSHNPPAPELLELCDRKGMVLMVEAFDCWRLGKARNDYHLLFNDWYEKDLRAMVRRDRNHPSVVLWSIGNEIREQRPGDGHKLAAELTSIVHDEDPTRGVTAGCNNVDAGYNGFQKTIDVFGYNYKPTEYTKFHSQNPSLPIAGSETSSCISTRGEYFFPVGNDKSGGKADFQMSSYDLYAPPWAWPPDVEWKGLDQNPFVAGEFVWTGFDYLGEPTPYNRDVTNLLNFSDASERARMEKELKELGKIRVPSRSSYFGILDLAGFKKDRFYLYQSRWKPEFPMVHILPHWNWPERLGQVTPVHVYSNGDEIELFLNGKSLGRKKREPLQYRFRWDDVVYEPGEVRAVAYKAGKKWSEIGNRTTGPAAVIMLKPDRATIKADGRDLSFVTVTIADKDGMQVPRAQNHVHFEVSGPGDIVAVDNGDPTSHDSFQALERNAFNGLCLVVIRSRRLEPGTITLKASSDALKGRTITLGSER